MSLAARYCLPSLKNTPCAYDIPNTEHHYFSCLFLTNLLTSVNSLVSFSRFFYPYILKKKKKKILSYLFSSPFPRIKRAWWFDRTGPRNLAPPSRPSVSAPSLNCYLPHFWSFPWQRCARDEWVKRVKSPVEAASRLRQLPKRQREKEKQEKESFGKLYPHPSPFKS